MPTEPKNIIVMVADGAGFNTLQATRLYLQGLDPSNPLAKSGLTVDQAGFVATAQSVFPLDTRGVPIPGEAGLAQNPETRYDPERNYDFTPVPGTVGGYPAGFEGYNWNRDTYPDSANTMSSMMTGVKTYNNAINVDGNGNPLLTLAELANDLGKSVGAVATVQISDATPAAGGGAHNVSRFNRQAIAEEMFSAGVLDVIAGTGNPDFDDNGNPRATPNYSWIGPDLWAALKNDSFVADDGSTWNLIQDRADILAAGSGAPTAERLAIIAEAFTGLNAYRGTGLNASNDPPFTTPFQPNATTLRDLTDAALTKLNTDDDGFFVTIENGEVDRAMHANNFGRMIEEYISFDQSVQFVLDWVNSAESDATWENTLLIVTADHDHLLFGPDGETIPYQPVQPDADGDGVPEYQWFSGSHSNQVIPLFAYGAGSDQLPSIADQRDGVYDAQGNLLRGPGRDYTDQAELGRFLFDQMRAESQDGNDANGLYGTTGNDTLLGQNGDDTIFGGEGRDAVRGGNGNDRLDGGRGNDLIAAGAGNDRVFGNEGNDNIRGNAGNDTLTGGAGRDTFVFTRATDGGDTITDFAAGDQIRIDASGFGITGAVGFQGFAAGNTAPAAGATFLYAAATGELSFDATGGTAEDAVVLATLTGTPSLAASDLVLA